MGPFTIQITEVFDFACCKQQLMLKQIFFRNILKYWFRN